MRQALRRQILVSTQNAVSEEFAAVILAFKRAKVESQSILVIKKKITNRPPAKKKKSTIPPPTP